MQESVCRSFAEGLNMEVKAVYSDEGISGANVNRPGLWSAINSCRKGDILLVWKRDRLVRSVYLSEVINNEVRKQGATVRAVLGDIEGDTPESVLMLQMLASYSEYERKVISARTKHAMLFHQAHGRRMSKHCPYGTKADPDDESRLVPVDHERKMITMIVEMAKTTGAYAIATQLNKNPSFKTMARHNKWTGKLIKKIIERSHQA
jgi:DNA invertase Pin-like site-specific DNA recombinase